MYKIRIDFVDNPPLVCTLNKDSVTEKYITLLEKNLKESFPIFRDNAKYTEEYFKKIGKELKEKLNWNWSDRNPKNLNNLHKDIENILDKSESFKNIPGDLQNLLHEAHFSIHALQYYNKKRPHGNFLQIEWFNNDYENLPNDATFASQPKFGDLILQNAYVGHPPIQCYLQNDFSNIDRTCAFPDRIKPGIKINLGTMLKLNFENYKKWWLENCTKYVDIIGWDKIKYYTGWTKIGQVEDIKILEKILQTKELKLKEVTVIKE